MTTTTPAPAAPAAPPVDGRAPRAARDRFGVPVTLLLATLTAFGAGLTWMTSPG